jgi:hypothetical protein
MCGENKALVSRKRRGLGRAPYSEMKTGMFVSEYCCNCGMLVEDIEGRTLPYTKALAVAGVSKCE